VTGGSRSARACTGTTLNWTVSKPRQSPTRQTPNDTRSDDHHKKEINCSGILKGCPLRAHIVSFHFDAGYMMHFRSRTPEPYDAQAKQNNRQQHA
jgi:hypothetical protein